MRLWIFGPALGLAAASLLFGAETEPRYAPSVYINGVVNGASFTPAPDNFIVPTGIISIFGEDLALRTRQVSQEDLFQGRLPYSLGGVSVRIAGQLVPLYFVSPKQVNVQAPANLPRGEARLRINRESLVSNEVMVKVREVDPAFFTVLGRPVIAHLDYSVVGRGEIEESTPAHPGEYVVLFMTGLGPTVPAVIEGQLPGPTTLLLPRSIWLDGRPLPPEFVTYAGHAPGLAGVYQINLLLPGDTPSGELEIFIEVNGLRSQPGMLLAVDPPE